MNNPQRSDHQEYAQQNYVVLRAQEEVTSFGNYLKLRKVCISSSLRAKAIQQIIEMQTFREYKMDTMFMAVSIFDKYMFLASKANVRLDTSTTSMHTLVCTCLLIAAKFEQPKKPDFQNMVYALHEMKGVKVSKKALVQQEQ